MLTLTSNEQAKSLIKNGVLEVGDDIEIAFNGFKIDADIKCHNICSKGYERDINARNIDAWNINAWNINARNIDAWNINARDINAWNINARDINAWNINAVNINAVNIDAGNINAEDIDARDINYWAVCFAYKTFKCKSVKGRRENSKHFCLDNEIEYIKKDTATQEAIELLKKNGYKIVKE
jgi:hypothetical protein